MKKDTLPHCSLCEYAKLMAGEDFVICDIKGHVQKYENCKKFIYDLTKHQPQRQKYINLEFPELD